MALVDHEGRMEPPDVDPKPAVDAQPTGLAKHEGDYRSPAITARLVHLKGWILQVWKEDKPITKGGGEYIHCEVLGRVPAIKRIEMPLNLTHADELPAAFKHRVDEALAAGFQPEDADLHITTVEYEQIFREIIRKEGNRTYLLVIGLLFIIAALLSASSWVMSSALLILGAGAIVVFAQFTAQPDSKKILAEVRNPSAKIKKKLPKGAKKIFSPSVPGTNSFGPE